MPRRRSSSRVLFDRDGLLVVADHRRPSGRFLWQDGMESSYIDLADERHLEFDYLRWMRIVLVALRARRVLHLGGGACSLARALASTDPGGLQQVAEVDADVLDVARAHLGLRRRPGLRVRHAEARRALAGEGDATWDAVVLDTFLGAIVPQHLTTPEAADDCARVAPFALVNVVDAGSGHEVTHVSATFREAFGYGWRIAGRGGNTVVLASSRPLDTLRLGAMLSADPAPARIEPVASE